MESKKTKLTISGTPKKSIKTVIDMISLYIYKINIDINIIIIYVYTLKSFLNPSKTFLNPP